MKTPKTTPLPDPRCEGGCVSRLPFTPSHNSQTSHSSHGKTGNPGSSGRNRIRDDSSAPYRLWGASLIAFLILTTGVLHYFILRSQIADLREQSARLALRASTIHRTLELAQNRLAILQAQAQTRAAVLNFAHNRVTWAPVLSAILECTDLSTLAVQFGETGLPDTSAEKPVHSKSHINSVECLCMGQDECILRVAGTISSTRPREDCDQFRIRLQNALKTLGIAAEGRFIVLKELLPLNSPNLEETEYALEFTWRTHH